MSGNGKINKPKIKDSDLVRTSRAGDAFHYRWAARFCLNMIRPRSSIESITIEQSKESERPGECVMDMAVYFNDCVHYYQMKHSVARVDHHVTLSELKPTLNAFANRFIDHKADKSPGAHKYIIVTNRKIDPKLLFAISKIANDEMPSKVVKDQLIRYTKLTENDLKDFCLDLKIQGEEGDYEDQFYALIGETGRLISGVGDTDIVNKLITMVQARALPNNRSEITRATVLNQFGCSNENLIYPAPSDFEKIDNVLIRDEYIRLAGEIVVSEEIKIITATGGVGKSAFTSLLPELLGENILTVTYDCFGNGTYGNRLKFRHRHKDALVQIANQLADLGYCEPLIPAPPYNDIDAISIAFQQRLTEAISRFRKIHEEGQLVIAIDAADNAELAAQINQDQSFVSDLIQQGLPSHCILVMLCRPERINMLNPPNTVIELNLAPFSIIETEKYLSRLVSDVTIQNAEEIHRLTNGNPRVLSIALQKSSNVKDILQRLGPKPTSAEEQVEVLLMQATNRIINQLSDNYKEEINALYCGLSVLPPDIPVKDLSAVTGVKESTINSFVSEMGAQIFLVEDHLYFRDEPTEYWFKKNYSENVELVNKFIDRIEPLTSNSYYLAVALPGLYMQAGCFDKMIEVVFKGMYLPETKNADIREVEYTRLKYAIKSSLNTKRYSELIGLGLIAGDKGEIHNRIYNLYQKNFDILHKFLSKEPVRELAYKGIIRGDWFGSDRLYSAVLLSGIDNGHPESRVYLRRAKEFLDVYLTECARDKEVHHNQELTKEDIYAIVLTVFNNFGIEAAIKEIIKWSPSWIQFELSRRLTSYLIDLSMIDVVYSFLNNSISNIYCVLGIVFELDKIGFEVDNRIIETIADNNDIENIEAPNNFEFFQDKDDAAPFLSLITLCEKFLAAGLDSQCNGIISRFFSHIKPEDFVSDYYNYNRSIALRVFAIKKHFQDDLEFFDEKYFSDNRKQYKHGDEMAKMKGIFNSLYLWYDLRLSIILGNCENVYIRALESKKSIGLSYEGQYGRFYAIEKERYSIAADIFLKSTWGNDSEALGYFHDILNNDKYGLPSDMVDLLRGLIKKGVAGSTIHELETAIYKLALKNYEEPYERVKILIRMARSLLGFNLQDAVSYFEEAVKENESFGDDLPSKWRAIASIAKKASSWSNNEQVLAYRFIRAAEFVGDHVIREKYWDRNAAVAITTLLSPAQGLASISRWRERDVGWIDEQLPQVFKVLITNGLLSAPQIWGLSGFFPKDEQMVVYLAIAAMKLSDNDQERQAIASQVNMIASIQGFSVKSCDIMRDILCGLQSFPESFYPGRKRPFEQLITSSDIDRKTNETRADQLLIDWSYTNINSVQDVLDIANSTTYHFSNIDHYWQSVLHKIPLQKYSDFLEDILRIQSIDFWKVTRIFANIPKIWKERHGFRKFWIPYLKRVGKPSKYD